MSSSLWSTLSPGNPVMGPELHLLCCGKPSPLPSISEISVSGRGKGQMGARAHPDTSWTSQQAPLSRATLLCVLSPQRVPDTELGPQSRSEGRCEAAGTGQGTASNCRLGITSRPPRPAPHFCHRSCSAFSPGVHPPPHLCHRPVLLLGCGSVSPEVAGGSACVSPGAGWFVSLGAVPGWA